MNIDKLLKFVWLGCGVVLLGILLTAVGAFVIDVLPGRSYVDHGVVVDTKASPTTHKIRAELSYGMPFEVGNSEYAVMKVFVAYKNTSDNLAADIGSSYDKEFEVNQPSNLIFLDQDLRVIRHLLDGKALIKDFRYPHDDGIYREGDDNLSVASMKFLCYEIARKDTDDDGEIDGDDASDLYISDLDGNNLKQITTGWDIHEIEFRNAHKSILVRYTERAAKNASIRYALYHVEKDEMTKLSSIDEEIKAIEKIVQQ